MSFLSALYTLVISPLELLFEIIFTIANKIIGNEGLSIIFLSLAVNFLVLPLYKRADELQAEERDIQAKMASRIKQIKHTFKGDERFFMLQEYYRINHYKPIYALKSSVSLLLQVPFFIAAYNLLSGMQSLQGMSFGFISDLGKEDATFMIGSFPVNILPILMTLINIVSGIIYTKGHPLKAKIQVYGLAAIFLVLLYHSPSGLVFYWLLNNVFSLGKNMFYKLKEPKKVFKMLLAAVGAVMFVTTMIRQNLDTRQKILLVSGCILLCIPYVYSLFKGKKQPVPKASTNTSGVFFAGAIFMALVTGLLIPSTVIDASATEFIEASDLRHPVIYLLNSSLLSFGSWVLWGGVFYFFMSEKTKAVFCKAIWIICGVSVLDYMLFGTKLGTMTSTLQYNMTLDFKISEYLLNTLVVVAVIIVFGLIFSKFTKYVKFVLIVAALSVFMIGIYHVLGICGTYDGFSERYVSTDEIPSIPLSKNGKNVVVLMLDRAMGTEIPYIFSEKPELIEQFDGFTYYPNTISYGSHTRFGTPALYGGYEYTPEKINERSSESLVSKQDEALKVMPVIFGDNDYEVTIFDPPYAGYNWIPDLSIYDDYPDFNCYNINGLFSIFDDNIESSLAMTQRVHEIRNRDFFFFSLMKISPVILQETVYDGGNYNESYSDTLNGSDITVSAPVQRLDGLSKSTGYRIEFIESFPVLMNLSRMTSIENSSNNTFLMMSNDTTHSECLLQEPDYVPASVVDNTAYDVDMVSRYTIDGITMQMETPYQVMHYHVNMAAMLQLGKWFDYLRENDVYNNTRIIIVSDHGRALGQFDITCNGEDMEYLLPLLMVKDFNSTGFTVSEEFMTNADVPTIAFSGIIDNPVNPFTGNPINSDGKDGPQTALISDYWDTQYNKGNTFLPGSWYTFLGGDPHDQDSWVYSGDY
ncbi:MAG: membrane protein insertase YidC [Ruminococcaceae bacterium]|nr:membrane protein insertase YidC [Oscillospiraceae bacterium]